MLVMMMTENGAQENTEDRGLCLKDLFADDLAEGLTRLLGMEAMLFAWDQSLIMGFSEVLPRVLFSVLVVIKDALLAAVTLDDLHTAMTNR